ncbi:MULTISPECIES: polyamine aminopropyltransferase [unclassified Clostridioides]|uniref:polyamine aminopropyltransferase n=1 Tax=unclassified Clostridioides TaxID=2635829 RepID=UPI001D124684|nr:polyamine aminopropyltransferase [Clostridioides sp. ZZV14-6153]MCC0719805.1 polyamine aminopropyltransferase [Clostridioides sp. ZZV14-6105]MCC0722125.1 polyamine aminopropyltransferase [Clostridioides sp. ZZV14-6104]MCC0728783.1 polyamine aminopropyltransferase [Clostridioides sp. ZZV14-6045]MCC0732220.1 polyamine aminopropyltransferase [Clostridioides sp. ZZV14-6048]MCC0736335.1 polyamine aminopropyltransferase [Clostridioides sp. ZZV14-6009]MCC0740077.1 polyamine aminopropyltransferase
MELWYTEEWTENVRFSIKVDRHLFEGKSEFQRIDVFDSEEFGKFLTIDGLMMVTYKDEFIYHDMITHVPMATNLNIKKVLVIGGGDGGTVRELSRYPKIEKIDMVEIDKMVVDVSKEYIDICSCKLDDKRVNLYFEDGVKFVKEAYDKSYDLIIVDSTDPIGPGEGLFSNDFYRDCYRILTDDGILVNQSESPYFEFNAKEMKRANDKLKGIFPISKVYQAHIPTYPSGHWLFGFASKKLDPIKNQDRDGWEKLNLKTKYYNSDIHLGSFMLPQYVKEMLNEE